MKNTLVCIDVYTVTPGDTLHSIGEKYDLPVSLLMQVNAIDDPYQLQVGTKLCIPGHPSQLPSCSTPSKPSVHIVEAGDTLYLIAKKYEIKLDDLMEQNPNIDPYNLMIGTKLKLPL